MRSRLRDKEVVVQVVDQAALKFPGDIYDFPRPLLNKNGNNFSFSGLKTAMLRFRERHLENISSKENAKMQILEEGPVLSSFFQSVVDVLNLEKEITVELQVGLTMEVILQLR